MELLSPGLGLIIWNLVAFLTLYLILKKFAWKPIIQSLKDREQTIADSIATAENVKAEMAQLQSENEALLAQAREERADILREAKATRDKMINEAKEQAKAEANRVLADLQVSIHNQKMAAITDIKNQMGSLVIQMSEKVLRRELNDKTAQEKFITELADSANLN